MIKVLFFAQTRELVGVETLDVEACFDTVEALRASLANREGSGTWLWMPANSSRLLTNRLCL